jgi:hypothetical protein
MSDDVEVPSLEGFLHGLAAGVLAVAAVIIAFCAIYVGVTGDSQFALELGGLCLLLGILSRAAWTMQEIDRVTTD